MVKDARPIVSVITIKLFMILAKCLLEKFFLEKKNIKTKIEKIVDIIALVEFWNIFGGVIPRTKSLINPPPRAVTRPSTITPSMSIFFLQPSMAPEIAKAIVPIMSKNTLNSK